MSDQRSQISLKSKASQRTNKTNQIDQDQKSVAPSVVSSTMSLEEQEEWTAIQKFNALLHYQEQKQAAERQRERTRLMKKQLIEQKIQKD